MEEERTELDEDRRHGDGDERRVCAVAAGRLAVAADPVAGDRQQQRGDPERLQGRDVDDEADGEPRDRAEDRPSQERDRHQRHEHEVGGAVEDVDLREQRDLHDRRDQQDRGSLGGVGDHRRFFGISTSTELRVLKSAKGWSWTLL